jgi:hypothetical protein
MPRDLWILLVGLLLGAFLAWGLGSAFEQAAEVPAECGNC